MKRQAAFVLIAAGVIGVAGCGEDAGPGPEESAPVPAAEQPAATGDTEMGDAGAAAESGTLDYEFKVIDHSDDEREFEIRKALNGVEAMLEDARANGWDTAELEQRKAELEQQLEQLTGTG